MTDYTPDFATCLMSGFTDELSKMAADFAALGLDADDLAKIANVANFLTSASKGSVGAAIAQRNAARVFGAGINTAGAVAPAAAAAKMVGSAAPVKAVGANVGRSLPSVASPAAAAKPGGLFGGATPDFSGGMARKPPPLPAAAMRQPTPPPLPPRAQRFPQVATPQQAMAA
jgi:predicted sugar kinase